VGSCILTGSDKPATLFEKRLYWVFIRASKAGGGAMRVTHLLTLFLFSIGIGCYSIAAPIPKQLQNERTVNYYFPCVVGSRLVYKTKGVQGVDVRIVTGVVRKDDEYLVTVMQERKGELIPSYELKVTPRGIIQLNCTGKNDLSSACWLKIPCKRGDSWENSLPESVRKWEKPFPEELKERIEVIGEESVEVPAGVYKTIRIESSSPVVGFPPGYSLGRDTIQMTIWYAPNVGVVKMKGQSWEQVLQSITLDDVPDGKREK
jgi:hypothetical protein